MAAVAGILGCSEAVASRYLAECGGDVEQAVMRWMGHAEVMGEIVASWASLGDFPPEIDEPVDSVPKSSEESTGGGEGGGSGKEEEDGGTGGGVASKAAAHERRQEAIGKILSRERRLGAELQNLQKGSKLNVEVSLCGDALDHWIVKLKPRHFPSDMQLHEDMLKLPSEWPGNIDHILLEVFFSKSYPRDPPFLRVVYPRFAWHTGHVNWGGSICLETLINTGGPAGYKSNLTFETILLMVMFNMTSDTEGTVVKAGRLDFERERDFDRLDYSLEDGLENFLRIARDHGWDKELDRARGSAARDEKPASWDQLSREFAERKAPAASTSFR